MKPVTGRIISSEPISVKSAAVVLARFVATDTRTSSSSQAVSAYLKRASAAVNELIQFHKDLKSSKRQGSSKKKTAAELFDDGSHSRAPQEGVENTPDSSRNKKKDGEKNDGVGEKKAPTDMFHVDRSVGDVDSIREGRRGEKKKVKREVENGFDDSIASSKKKKKKRRTED